MLTVYIICFVLCAVLLLYMQYGSGAGKRHILKKLYSETVVRDLKRVGREPDQRKSLTAYYRNKIRSFLVIMLAGCAAAALAELKELNQKELINGRFLKRAEYEGESRNVKLWAINELSGEKEKVTVEVSEKKYGYEALTQMLQEIEGMLPGLVLGENESADMVRKELDFKNGIEGYPFRLSYRTDNSVLSSTGQIDQEKLCSKENASEGIVVKVIMRAEYEDFSGEIVFYVRVCPEEPGEKEFSDILREGVEGASRENREEDYLELPASLESADIRYEETAGYESLVIFILGITASFLFYFKKDEELSNERKRRDRQLLSDYPMLVNKFALFYSVGMTTRGIFLKLCKDYEKKKENKKQKKEHYLYEEMLRTRRKMEEGIGETAAYEEFAARLALPKYRQLVNLMEQAVLKGKSDITLQLSEELSKSFSERKNRAKELSEEAGTKLLIPMFLMLFVVIVIIMVPAFMSFKV